MIAAEVDVERLFDLPLFVSGSGIILARGLFATSGVLFVRRSSGLRG